MTELAIFLIDQFLFGVETTQIQEILTVQSSDFSEKTDPALPFELLQYRQSSIPVFDLRRRFCLSPRCDTVLHQEFSAPLITFCSDGLLTACDVTSIEDIIPVSSRFLKSVPVILTGIACDIHVWGFYETPDALLPLVDLEHVISHQEIELYRKFLSGLPGAPGSKRII